jgi:hypothetical protein
LLGLHWRSSLYCNLCVAVAGAAAEQALHAACSALTIKLLCQNICASVSYSLADYKRLQLLLPFTFFGMPMSPDLI